ncbi:MAG: heme exporter protein CcmB [Bacteroidota bacterium]|nr:heme exporter protein CcmB [Bacteroidota bacterium]
MTIHPALALLAKDFRGEWRTRYAVNTLLMFIVVTLSVVVFALAGETLTSGVQAGLLWVVLFFSAMNGMSRSFLSEEERGTTLTLRLLADPSAIYLGKLLFNLVLALLLNVFIVLLFLVFLEGFLIRQPGLFLAVILGGGAGVAAATTVIAAMIARAGSKGPLFPVLSFPVLLPLLMSGISATKIAMEETEWTLALPELGVLASYIAVVVAASFFLFDFVWKD